MCVLSLFLSTEILFVSLLFLFNILLKENYTKYLYGESFIYILFKTFIPSKLNPSFKISPVFLIKKALDFNVSVS